MLEAENKMIELAERIADLTVANQKYAVENEELQEEIVALKEALSAKEQSRVYARASFVTIQDSLETLRRTVVLLQQGGEKE